MQILQILLIVQLVHLMMMMMMMMMMVMMMMMNSFCDIVDQKKRRLALFLAGTIIRDPHHRKFPTRREQDLNLRRI